MVPDEGILFDLLWAASPLEELKGIGFRVFGCLGVRVSGLGSGFLGCRV